MAISVSVQVCVAPAALCVETWAIPSATAALGVLELADHLTLKKNTQVRLPLYCELFHLVFAKTARKGGSRPWQGLSQALTSHSEAMLVSWPLPGTKLSYCKGGLISVLQFSGDHLLELV